MKRKKLARATPVLKKTRSIKDWATGNWSDEFQIVQVDGRRTSRTGGRRRGGGHGEAR